MNLLYSQRNSFVVIAALSLFLLTACELDIGVSIDQMKEKTILNFGVDSWFNKDFDPACLEYIEVQETLTEKVVWKISKNSNSCSLLNRVALGQSLPGFEEKINELPLRSGVSYTVSILVFGGGVTSDPWTFRQDNK